MTSVAAPAAVKFHLSLNVTSLDRSVEFFSVLFGREPAKCRSDYAKFELDEPPVVLSLEPGGAASGGALNHLGFRLSDSAELVEWQRRLEGAGIATQREEGVECCYARQTKFWVRDSDNNLWEIYVLEEDIEHRGMGQVPDTRPTASRASAPQAASNSAGPAKSIWQHQLGTPLPAKIFAHDNSTAEVYLRGSFNGPHSAEDRKRFFREVYRILQPGGSALLHHLTAERSLSLDLGTLPGPASYVTFVPGREELLDDLAAAGFQMSRLTKFGPRPCFQHQGAEMRETMLTAIKPSPEEAGEREVVYLGPLAAVKDDTGTQYVRGKRNKVSERAWEALANADLAGQFVCLEGSDGRNCGS